MDAPLSVRFTATERRERGAARRVLIDRGPAERALARRSMHGTLRHRSGALAARCRWNVIRSFIMKSGCRSCALAAASSSALGINRAASALSHTMVLTCSSSNSAAARLRSSASSSTINMARCSWCAWPIAGFPLLAVIIDIQSAHERRQRSRERGRNSFGECSPQLVRERQREIHSVER